MAESITVTQFDELVKRTLTNTKELCDIFVSGEISESKIAASGHMYFTLKDGQAILRCNMWRSSVQTLKFRPEIGLKVTAFGSVDFYPPGHRNYCTLLRSGNKKWSLVYGSKTSPKPLYRHRN